MSVPTHIAIVMDGNGRWAEERGKIRTQGHREGAKRVDEIVTECCELGVRHLTLYAFSTENWSRPRLEVNLLMTLLIQHLRSMDKKLIKNRVRLSAQGTLHRLPARVLKELARVTELTNFTDPKLELSLALSYGGRQEIIDATKGISRAVADGRLDPEKIDEDLFRKFLYQPGFPDPDLLIRTGGECRVSNFLLWEIAYSEFVVVDRYWPDFRPANLRECIETFNMRERRFGKTSKQVLKPGIAKKQPSVLGENL